ncbi:MAG: 50S ribosomal protein L17 [Opitutales bacterium]|jgi:large subunit ribosomal protein L17
MRHLKHRSQLGRTKEHRAALIANLSAALLTHGRIKTTLAKAKALRPFVEQIITLAVHASKTTDVAASLHLRRQAIAKIRDKDAVAILFKDRVEEFKSRPGGYTRIYKIGPRIGDGAEMALIELIPAADTGYAKSRKGKSVKAEEAALIAETVVAEPESSAGEEDTKA